MTTQDITEVNNASDSELDEILTADDLENPDSNDIGDAIVEDPENAPLEEEGTDTPSDSSAEDKPTDDDESDEDEDEDGDDSSSDDEPDPKPVPGETPREAALRQEVARVKAKLRSERGGKMFKDVPADAGTVELSEEDQQFLAEVDPEQAANVERLIAISAKKMGFVKKEEFAQQTYKEQAQSVLDDFLEKHPEYDESNDPDGMLWGQFQKEYQQYKAPGNPKDLNKLFSKIHKDIFGVSTDDKGLKQVAAKTEKVKVASHSASSSSGSAKQTESKIDDETKSLVGKGAMKGFSDEELAELGLQ